MSGSVSFQIKQPTRGEGIEFIHVERAALDHGLIYTLEYKTELDSQVWSNVTNAVLLGVGVLGGGYRR